MSNNVYLATTGPAAGKSALALGLMSLIEREVPRVGYFRPIGRTGSDDPSIPDPSVELVCSVFGMEVVDHRALEHDISTCVR